MIYNVNELKHRLGFCLVVIGVPMGMLLNYFVPIVKWSPLIMIISILFLSDFSTIRNKIRINNSFKALLVLQLMMIIYWFLLDNHLTLINYLFFHLFIIALVVVFSISRKLQFCDYLKELFILSSSISIIAALLHFFNIIAVENQINGDDSILDVFTLNMAAYVSIISGICLLKKKWSILFCVQLIILAIDFYVIIQSGKRSYFVSVFVALFFYAYKMKYFIRSLIYLSSILLLLFVVSPTVRTEFETISTRTMSGFTDVYGSKKVDYDENSSSSIRKNNQIKILNRVDREFHLGNYVFGGGYLYAFIDAPWLEAYFDMGILGWILYTYLIILVPLTFLRRVNGDDKLSVFIFLNTLVNISVLLTNNNPYSYFVYTPICLIALYKRRKNVSEF